MGNPQNMSSAALRLDDNGNIAGLTVGSGAEVVEFVSDRIEFFDLDGRTLLRVEEGCVHIKARLVVGRLNA